MIGSSRHVSPEAWNQALVELAGAVGLEIPCAVSSQTAKDLISVRQLMIEPQIELVYIGSLFERRNQVLEIPWLVRQRDFGKKRHGNGIKPVGRNPVVGER